MGFFKSLKRKIVGGSSVQHPENWLMQQGMHTTKTGLKINEQNSLEASAVWSSVLQLSSIVGSLPLKLFKRTDVGRDEATEHPLSIMMSLKPNDEMTSMIFREALVLQMLLYGFAVAEKQFNKSGQIIGLWPLESSRMLIKRVVIEGQAVLLYEYRMISGATRIFSRDQILHIPYLSTNGIQSLNPIKLARESIGLAKALEDYAAKFFLNNAKPAAVIEIPGGLDKEAMDNFKESWAMVTQGLDNAHRTAVLEEGIKLHEYGSNPKTSQSLESREFQLDEVARVMNMPPHMLKNLKRATFSNIEESNREFVTYSLNQILVRKEQNYTLQLLDPKLHATHFFKHNLDGLLRGNTEVRWSAYNKGFLMGVYSPNDIRKLEDLNTYEGGDDRYVQMQMVKVQDAGLLAKARLQPKKKADQDSDGKSEDDKGADDSDGDERMLPGDSLSEKEVRQAEHRSRQDEAIKIISDDVSRFKPLFEEAFQKIINKEAKEIEVNAQKELRNIRGFDEWLWDFYDEALEPFAEKVTAPIFQIFIDTVQRDVAAVFGVDTRFNQEMEDFVRTYIADFTARTARKSIQEIRKIIRDNGSKVGQETVDLITARTKHWRKKKASKMVGQEVVRAAGAASRMKYVLTGFTRFQWRTVGDNCPFCNKLNGRTVGVEQTFVESGEKMEGENILKDGTKEATWMTFSERKKHPPLHRGCDCVVVPVLSF